MTSLEDLLECFVELGSVLRVRLADMVELAFNFGYGLQEELADVGADRGIARRDALGGE